MPAIDDFLTKQIYIDKNLVTFRSLSRQFGLHVNAAKNELARFHSSSVTTETRSFATYLVSGELFSQPRTSPNGATQSTEESMDVDADLADTVGEGEEGEEEVPTTTMTLVGEKDLEGAKSKYARIYSVHVYCLSPSPLTDAGLICDPSAVVYKADAVDAPNSSIALGRIVGPDVRIGKVPPPVASSSKAPEPISRKPTLKAKTEDTKSPDQDKGKGNTIKPKASGKLDWSKAKKSSEAVKKEKDVKVKKEESPVRLVKAETPLKSESESPQDGSKRGVKRKAALPTASDTEEKPKVKEEKSKVTPAHDLKLRKNRILSDDEDEDYAHQLKLKAKRKSKVPAAIDAFESDAERSLRAMMDMDDDDVELASKSRPRPNPKLIPTVPSDEDIEMAASEPEPVPPSEPERDDEDMEMGLEEDIPKPKPQPKKKAAKKAWPVGRNGLKKKRIVRSRVTTDAKGYMVTENYSEYESVDEEEAAAEEAKKVPKGKKASATKPKKGDAEERASAPKPKPVARSDSVKKRAGGRPSAQGSLKDFFGKPKS
ncbi:DNA polymerase subunit Cdc27 [Dichomitus squalens]|uniref:DNA polymerase delta subunit 3 n=1 Tax=Dichomitus squalens TaxID=114155 RepID=A0A4Q9P564_9APHY|nr:DNA polymerase subunit Cdc27 [Dichomitus squalens]TBU59128.1 DNA polymerase subunit Cdc27 [Dichomitus squalens]